MPYKYVKTGRPAGRPKKPPTVLVSSALVADVPPWEPDVPETIEGVAELEVPEPSELMGKVRLLVSSKQARLEHLAEWMLTTRDIRVAELLLRACGDLLPVQLLQQNNYQAGKAPTSEAEVLMQVISNGRGPAEWKPPAQLEEPEQDPVLDAPANTSPIPEPAPEEPLVEPQAEPDPEDYEAILASV